MDSESEHTIALLVAQHEYMDMNEEDAEFDEDLMEPEAENQATTATQTTANDISIIKEYYPLSVYGPEIVPLQIEYPENVHLFRGNHEAADINALFGFRLECIERMGESDGIWAWTRFNHLPLAALIENKII
ncbi:hypothetical protein F2Q68_00002421 [Brassica cretica]|uniref:Calcineurin-like phosphoesterase domain-containing protein n=1 Tax=Brassica cretica TaxID=69181 RepID=A0A8S9JK76_BRACR|nr:hypothetical protein F2Q68_00002421 [Brassica cretica]